MEFIEKLFLSFISTFFTTLAVAIFLSSVLVVMAFLYWVGSYSPVLAGLTGVFLFAWVCTFVKMG